MYRQLLYCLYRQYNNSTSSSEDCAIMHDTTVCILSQYTIYCCSTAHSSIKSSTLVLQYSSSTTIIQVVDNSSAEASKYRLQRLFRFDVFVTFRQAAFFMVGLESRTAFFSFWLTYFVVERAAVLIALGTSAEDTARRKRRHRASRQEILWVVKHLG